MYSFCLPAEAGLTQSHGPRSVDITSYMTQLLLKREMKNKQKSLKLLV